MRLRLVIIRHGLPAARILWTVPLGQGSHPVSSSELTSNITPNAAYGQGTCTIAQLLEDVNEVVPLETAAGELGENDEFGGQWGLEDYVVEVNHFECLHFMDIGGLLRDGDEVVIRALGLSDLRARRLSGRVQISSDGRRLIDGVSFGRPFLKRSFSSRPPIRIPPRKRRRTTFAGWAGNAQQDDYDEEVDTTQSVIGNELTVYEDVSEQGTVIRHSPKLYDDANDSENDDDSSSSVDYSEDEDLAEELKVLRDEADENSPPDQIDTESPRMTRSSGRVSRMTYRLPIPTSSPERPSEATPPRFTNSTAGVEPSPKSTKSVRFGLVNIKDSARTDDLLPPDSEDESYESDDESVAESSSSETSNLDSSVENTQDDALSNMEADSSDSSTSDESSVSEETDSESESESDSPSLMEEPEQTVVYTAPGRGSTKTKNSNRRKKLRTRLKKLKELGHLPAEANFEDLQKWELDHGKIPLMEVTDLEKPRSSQARQEQSEFEKRRQQLLRDLASGGIDVDAHSEKENIPPKSKNGRDSATNTPKQVEAGGAADKSVEMVDASIVDEGDEEGEPSPSSNKRRKLDISSTKRLLFGSLGVRTPKTKEDEERTRNKLAGPRKEIQESNGKKPNVLEEEIESDHEDNWQSKVILAATECIFNDVELIPPPFPFQQRWDADAVSTIRQLKGSKNKRSKKKRKSQDYHEEEYYEEYYDDAGYLGDATEDYANGDITLNYDDEPSTLHEHPMETYTNGEDVSDLPQLPEDMNSVPNLSQSEAVAGTIIAFMQLDMSKATNWQPRVSGYRVGRIDFVLGDGSLSIQLAKRDREKRETVIDEDGVREYSGFEMPDDEEEEALEDDGFRSLSFDELLEPKLLQPANQEKAASVVDGSQEPSLHNATNFGRSNASAGDSFHSVEAELPTVSSQARLEISQIIRDAGFRSTIDSDVCMPVLENGVVDEVGEQNEGSLVVQPSPSITSSSSSSEEADGEQGSSLIASEVENENDDNSHESHTSSSKDGPSDFSQAATGSDTNEEPQAQTDDNILRIDRSDLLQKSFAGTPTSYQVPVKTQENTPCHPQFPHMSSQPGDNDESNRDIESGHDNTDNLPNETQNINSELETALDLAGDDSLFQYDSPPRPASRSGSEASGMSRSSSMVPHPFYEADRATRLARKEADGTQETLDSGFEFSIAPDNERAASFVRDTAGKTQGTTTLRPDDFLFQDVQDLDDVELPSFETLWASTAPPRPVGSGESRIQKIKKTRRALSSPRQLSSSPTFETQRENQIRNTNQPQQTPTLSAPQTPKAVTNDDGDATSFPAFDSIEPERPTTTIVNDDTNNDNNQNDSVIDLTVSSPRVSPGGSDEDYAKSQGLPKGPGWVKKNIPATQRRTRSSTGGVALSSSPPATRRRGRRS